MEEVRGSNPLSSTVKCLVRTGFAAERQLASVTLGAYKPP
jgi:hypothetical protein